MKKRLKETKRAETTAAANQTLPPGCSNLSLPSPPPPPLSSPESAQLPTLFVYHDSNLKKVSTTELKKSIDSIIGKTNNNSYNVSMIPTYTLPQTLEKVKTTTFKPNDRVVIHIMTNDARQTKSRRRRTPYQTKILMTNILRHLLSFVPRSNVSIVEAPPLNDAPESDIYPYNQASFDVAQQHGVHFARTLIGENHLWRDGYHIQDTHRHLLVKSIAAAAVEIDPNDFFGLKRPPYGHFGPWESPKGVGFFPLAFNEMAVRQPMYFRGPPPIRPLMCIDIPRPR